MMPDSESGHEAHDGTRPCTPTEGAAAALALRLLREAASARDRARGRTDRPRPGDRRRRPRHQHEARPARPCWPISRELEGKPLGEIAEGRRHEARDEGRRRLGPALRHAGMELGKHLPPSPSRGELVAAFAAAIEAVKARGKSEVGQKTMLDVLAPVQARLAAGGSAAPSRPSGARAPPKRRSRCGRSAAAPRSSANAPSAMSIPARAPRRSSSPRSATRSEV